MKKSTIFLAIGILLTAAMVFFTSCQCGDGAKGEYIKPYEKTTFDEVTSKLNPGGNLYLYASTDRIVKVVDDMATKLRKLIESNMTGSPDESKEALNAFDFVYSLIKNSGLTEISGIGISSVSISEKLNHSKLVVYHHKDKGKGLMWNVSETTPHDFPLLKMLPADTVLASFADFKFKTAWDWFKTQASSSNIPKLKEGINGIEPMLEKQGIQLPQILESLSAMGFVVTLNSNNKQPMSFGEIKMEIPEPAIAFVFSAKDDTIFNLIKGKLPPTQVSEEKGVKKISIPAPSLPVPFPVEPVIFQKDNLLFFASNTKIMEAMLTAQEKGEGLIATEEFKKLSTRVPDKGNSFRFVSPRFLQSIIDVQKMVVKSTSGDNPDAPGMKVFDMLPKEIGGFNVCQNTPEGTVITFNHTMSIENLVFLPATAVIGVVAAIAIPNLLTATQNGKQKATMGDLKTISQAIELYISDHDKAPAGKSLEEIQKELQPFYIKTLPLKDAWGNDFLYTHGTASHAKEYKIGSGGKDGVFNGWEQQGSYIVTNVDGFNNDIIISDGTFVYGPKVK